MTEQVPAGWYPDARSPGDARWWDGKQWTGRRLVMTELQDSESAPRSHEVIEAAAPPPRSHAPAPAHTSIPPEAADSDIEVRETIIPKVTTFPPTQVAGMLIELDTQGVLLFRKIPASTPHHELFMSTVSAVRVNDKNNIIDFDRVGQPPLVDISATSATSIVRAAMTSKEEWQRIRDALIAAERQAVEKSPAPPGIPSRVKKEKKAKVSKPGRMEGWISAVFGGLIGTGMGAFAGGLAYTLVSGAISAAGFGTYFYLKAKKEASARGIGGIHTLGGVTFSGARISYAGQSQAIAGARVEVLTSGQISRRFDWGNTITGAALFGPVGAMVGAGEKKTDDRELYLVIAGAERVWSVKLNPKDSELAHTFAAAINTAALRAVQ
jgi:hypothetical protein